MDCRPVPVKDALDHHYYIPPYQRDYCWTESEVEAFLEDIYESLSNDSQQPYFIGSMVVVSNNGSTDHDYDVIDGQQRLTTIVLLLAQVANAAKYEHGDSRINDIVMQRLLSKDFSDFDSSSAKYVIDAPHSHTNSFLHQVIDLDARCTLGALTTANKNLLNAVKTIDGFLTKFETIEELTEFVSYIWKQVLLVRIETKSIERALTIFETINQRGISLNTFDLLKNMLFVAVHNMYPVKEDELIRNWNEISENVVNKAKDKPMRFVRYVIMSRLAKAYAGEIVRESGAFNWLNEKKQEIGISTEPIEFSRTLLHASSIYSNLIGKKPDEVHLRNPNERTVNGRLQWIAHLVGSAGRMHVGPILAVSDKSPHWQKITAEFVEVAVFLSLIQKERSQVLERRIAAFTNGIGKARFDSDFLDCCSSLAENCGPIIPLAWEQFEHLSENSLTKYRVKYILGRIASHVNNFRTSDSAKSERHPFPSEFIGQDTELEHILPQNTDLERWEKVLNEYDPEVVEQSKVMLGNLVLIEKYLNRDASNDTFDQKKLFYERSRFLIASTLSGPKAKYDEKVIQGLGLRSWDDWGPAQIKERQTMLTELAKAIWVFPDVATLPL